MFLIFRVDWDVAVSRDFLSVGLMQGKTDANFFSCYIAVKCPAVNFVDAAFASKAVRVKSTETVSSAKVDPASSEYV